VGVAAFGIFMILMTEISQLNSFFLVIWGILNYVWFSWISSDFGVFNALIYLAELFHYKYILNTIAVAMIFDSFKALFGPVYNIKKLKR
jgi:hypothetical protein